MPDPYDTALARLREFRRSWEDDAQIDEESGLTAADLDVLLARLEGYVAVPRMG